MLAGQCRIMRMPKSLPIPLCLAALLVAALAACHKDQAVADGAQSAPAKTRPASTRPAKPPVAPYWDQPSAQFTAKDVAAWATRQVDGKSSLVSRRLEWPAGDEVNHHRITITYDGSAPVQVALVYSNTPSLDDALKVAYLHTAFQPAASGKELLITTPYAGMNYAWILLQPGAATIKEIRHSCWRAKCTMFGHQAKTFEFAGQKLPYRLMYPRNYDSKKSYPLVVSISCSGTEGDDNAKQMNVMILGRFLFTQYYFDQDLECFSLVPQIPSGKAVPADYWPRGTKGAPTTFHPDWPAVNEDGWFAQATLALIASLDKDPAANIDPDRVYCTGYSYGGKAVFELEKAGPDLFAGSIASAGWAIGPAYYNYDPSQPVTAKALDQLKIEVKRYKHIPIQICDGKNDPMHLSGKAASAEITAQGGKSQYVEFPSADHAGAAGSTWSDQQRIEWLFKQNRADNPKP
jgi:poly(3-hydroxybutyrate) depolymerase